MYAAIDLGPHRLVALCALAAAIATVMLAIASAIASAPARADGPGVGSPWVVSVGDSYISGEAGRWAGNTKKRRSCTFRG